jgi:hypothetical protein
MIKKFIAKKVAKKVLRIAAKSEAKIIVGTFATIMAHKLVSRLTTRNKEASTQ